MPTRRALLVASLTVAGVVAGLPAHAAGALVDVQIVDRSLGQVLPAHRYRSVPYVAGQPGNRYAVRMVNRTGARRVRIGERREVERRRLGHALAPAGDLGTAVRREHVAGLVDGRGLAADRIDAVDGQLGELARIRDDARRIDPAVAAAAPLDVPAHELQHGSFEDDRATRFCGARCDRRVALTVSLRA